MLEYQNATCQNNNLQTNQNINPNFNSSGFYNQNNNNINDLYAYVNNNPGYQTKYDGGNYYHQNLNSSNNFTENNTKNINNPINNTQFDMLNQNSNNNNISDNITDKNPNAINREFNTNNNDNDSNEKISNDTIQSNENIFNHPSQKNKFHQENAFNNRIYAFTNHHNQYNQNSSNSQFTILQNNKQRHQFLSKEDQIRQKIDQETQEVTRTGQYPIFNRSEKHIYKINIKNEIEWSIYNTVTIKPSETIFIPEDMPFDSPMAQIVVTTDSHLTSLHRIVTNRQTEDTCILNFASPTEPGGGFLNGRNTQEGTLCRQSSLFTSLHPQIEMYEHNKLHSNDPFYSDYMIYSPGITFFRNDNFSFINFFRASVVTSPPINFSELVQRGARLERIYAAMKSRCERILRLAIWTGNRAIVIGAFGCEEPHKNPPEMVSQIFRELLYDGGYGRYFETVVFPIASEMHYIFQKAFQKE